MVEKKMAKSSLGQILTANSSLTDFLLIVPYLSFIMVFRFLLTPLPPEVFGSKTTPQLPCASNAHHGGWVGSMRKYKLNQLATS